MKQSNLWANKRLRLIVTGECNIGCFYCHNEGQPKSFQYFSDDLFNRLLQLVSFNSESLNSITFSGGEPLLHKKLENFTERLSPYTPQRTIVTNGLLLDMERLSSLLDAGLTKVRLGVDSLRKKKSRPTQGKFPDKNIQDIIEILLNREVELELNIVLTKFNSTEIGEILRFCQDNKLSAKFFEHVEVRSFGIEGEKGNIESKPVVPFETFHSIAIATITNCSFTEVPGFKDANYYYEGTDISIRYCRYLCPYGLCYKTGTRVDPYGFVYTCMKQRGQYRISNNELLSKSISSIKGALDQGC